MANKVNIEFIFDSDCPNVLATRANLKAALAELNIPYEFLEHCRQDGSCPPHAINYGSPTILVNGNDVIDEYPSPNSCRIYEDENGQQTGVPSVAMIKNAINARGGAVQSSFSWLRILAVLPVIGATLLPVLACPACWPVYVGLLSALGLGFINYSPYLLHITIVLLTFALFSLGYKASCRRGYGPLALGVVGALLLLAGKFYLEELYCSYVGVIVLVVAAIWNAWPRYSKNCTQKQVCKK